MVHILGVHGIRQQGKSSQRLSTVWTHALGQHWENESALQITVPYLSPILTASDHLGTDADPMTDEETAFVIAGMLEVLGDPSDDRLDELAHEGTHLGVGFIRTPPEVLRVLRAVDAARGQDVTQIFRLMFREVHNYLTRSEIRETVHKALFTDCNTPDLVIAHSLGSVIAYDQTVHGAPVPRLLTMGSPLGLATIRNHPTLATNADPAPASWVNIHDLGDPITVGIGLSDVWPGVRDVPVTNTVRDAHGAKHYLAHPETAAEVTKLLRSQA